MAVTERPYKLIARMKIVFWFIEKKAISYLDEGILYFERSLKDYLPRPKHAVLSKIIFSHQMVSLYYRSKYTAP